MTQEYATLCWRGAMAYLRRSGYDRQTIEELAQEAVLRALLQPAMDRPVTHGWLRARDASCKHQRRDRTIRRTYRVDYSDTPGWRPLLEPEIGLEVRRSLECIPERHRAAIVRLLDGDQAPTATEYKRQHWALEVLRQGGLRRNGPVLPSIIERLHEPATVAQLAEQLDLSPATVSTALRAGRKRGLTAVAGRAGKALLWMAA